MGNDLCRELVSAIPNHKRYTNSGHNLDLACFQEERLVVMAWPADDQIFVKDMKRSKLIRNDSREVRKCLEDLYPAGFKIYNLCSEHKSFQRAKDVDVVQFGWIDHEPPPFELLQRLIDDMFNYLSQHPNNGIAIHCKAGKGRTGTAASSFLMRQNKCKNSMEALSFFGSTRFGDGDGVKIQSQRRYVQYYQMFLNNGMVYNPKPLKLTKIQIFLKKPVKESKKLNEERYKLTVKQYNKDSEDEEKELETVFEVKNLKSVLDPDENISIDVPKNCPLLRGDVKFRLTRNEQGIFCKEKAMAVFWINSAFEEEPCISVSAENFDMKKENCVQKVSQVKFHVQVQENS